MNIRHDPNNLIPKKVKVSLTFSQLYFTVILKSFIPHLTCLIFFLWSSFNNKLLYIQLLQFFFSPWRRVQFWKWGGVCYTPLALFVYPHLAGPACILQSGKPESWSSNQLFFRALFPQTAIQTNLISRWLNEQQRPLQMCMIEPKSWWLPQSFRVLIRCLPLSPKHCTPLLGPYNDNSNSLSWFSFNFKIYFQILFQ